jgi:hypothetical protein
MKVKELAKINSLSWSKVATWKLFSSSMRDLFEEPTSRMIISVFETGKV